MKNFYLIITVCVMSILSQNIEAQSRYEKSVEIGYGYGLNEFSKYALSVSMIHGIKINDYLFTGIGVGFKYTDALYIEGYNADKLIKRDESRDNKYIVPVFLRFKANFTDYAVSPFFAGDFGYAIDVTGNPNPMKGLVFEPMIGLDIKLPDNRTTLYTSVGVNFNKAQYHYFYLSSSDLSYNEIKNGYASFISGKFGIKF